MKYKGIVLKLFFLILSIVLIVQVFQFAFQSIFLETFYESSIINNLESEISSLKTDLTIAYSNKLPTSHQEVNKLNSTLLKFSHNNNSAVIIYDLYGNPCFGDPSTQNEGLLYVKTDNFAQVKVDIYPDDLQELVSNYDLSVGSEITIKGKFIPSENIMYPLEIIIDNTQFIVNEIYESTESTSKESAENNFPAKEDNYNNISKFECKIVFINYSDINNNILYSYDSLESILYDELFNYLDLNDESNESNILNLQEAYYKTQSDDYETESLIFFEPIKLYNEQFILGVSIPYTPIEGTVYIIQNYYIYYFFFAIIVITLASIFLSKILSSPLLKLNQTAHKMASLDFSEKCDIVSNDELGTLSQSLNTLSSNLERYKNELDSANEQLKEQLNYKEMQEKLRKEFMANISHELKTPLTVMNGILEGIEDKIYTESPEKYLSILKEEVDYMQSMVYELLQLSKLDSPSFELDTAIVNLNDVFLKINNKFHSLVKEKLLSVNFNYEDGFVIGDRIKLTEVLSNLFLNAIKYSPCKENINVNITTSKDKVRFSIENTGTHIPSEDIPKIWNEFYRVEKSRNRDSGGTGLGLLIVKKILEKHGASYSVINTEKGVQFYFEMDSVDEYI
ncbi:sensor histidine kinase [Oceanirhabdus sp. W0125-5]|uniref:sensor histidine kinase n=1 Tax=Oceanirhabdus sp. W0125-5 TaxID=2999116 RepID=UPI0022F2ACE7|nr:HAMP domain-containing sensor histidine kinase [Oceanirhabdus sp. W0125-5]WBW99264.1 HAMP domain-containing sensor histidine kinase [Oceanirhabdus sp. W0125-5]